MNFSIPGSFPPFFGRISSTCFPFGQFCTRTLLSPAFCATNGSAKSGSVFYVILSPGLAAFFISSGFLATFFFTK